MMLLLLMTMVVVVNFIVCATWNAVQCFALSSVSKAAYQKNLLRKIRLHPPLVRGFTAQHPCVSPSQLSSRVSRRFECPGVLRTPPWLRTKFVRDRAC